MGNYSGKLRIDVVTLKLPIRDFVLTAHGNVLKNQVPMNRCKVKTIGFSILRQPGDFSLEIDWIKATNSMNTFGDMNILDKNEYIDKDGRRKKEVEGQVRVIPPNPNKIRLFPVSQKDKSWF